MQMQMCIGIMLLVVAMRSVLIKFQKLPVRYCCQAQAGCLKHVLILQCLKKLPPAPGSLCFQLGLSLCLCLLQARRWQQMQRPGGS